MKEEAVPINMPPAAGTVLQLGACSFVFSSLWFFTIFGIDAIGSYRGLFREGNRLLPAQLINHLLTQCGQGDAARLNQSSVEEKAFLLAALTHNVLQCVEGRRILI